MSAAPKPDPTDACFTVEKTVIAFGLSSSTMETLKTVCDKIHVRIWDADSLTDVFSVPCFVAIGDFSSVEPVLLQKTFDFIEQVGDVTLLFTEPPSIAPPASLNLAKPPDQMDEESLRFILMRTRRAITRQSRRERKYDKGLARLFFILKTIEARKFVRATDFIDEFNVSSRTINRDFKLLIAMGEPLEYDERRKGYVLWSDGDE
jgi:hypothetical protein